MFFLLVIILNATTWQLVRFSSNFVRPVLRLSIFGSRFLPISIPVWIYFSASYPRFKSLLRQLITYKFVRVTKQGPNKGPCSHPSFQRGRRSLCTTMIGRKPHPKVATVPAVAAPVPAMALQQSSRVPAVPPRMAALAATTPDDEGPPRWTLNPITAQSSKRPSLVTPVMPRVTIQNMYIL